MSHLYDHLLGRWSASSPVRAGVYLVRERDGATPWVTYWSADAAAPFGRASREFFHLEGDEDGSPTRWDDPRVAEMAVVGGWVEAPTNERRRGR